MSGLIGKISSRSKIVNEPLTDGGILLGSGSSAITATAVLADSEMLVGDGTTDPAIESGATLRTSIGLGNVNNVADASQSSFGTVTSGTISTGVVVDDPTMTQGSDATGDVYYRAADGKLTRLPTTADGHVLTSTGVGAVPAWEAVAASGISSPWQHIASWGTNVDLSGTYYINFQGVFSEEYTMYKILIPFLNTTSSGGDDDLLFRFMSGDIDTTSKSITVDSSTTDHEDNATYSFITMQDGVDPPGGAAFDGGSYAHTDMDGYDVTYFILFDSFLETTAGNSGCRGEINIYNPHKTKIWNYAGTPAQLAVTRGGSYYGPSVDWKLYGTNKDSGDVVNISTGTGYYNTMSANDFYTGFTLWTGSNIDIGRNSMVHILGLKLDLVTS